MLFCPLQGMVEEETATAQYRAMSIYSTEPSTNIDTPDIRRPLTSSARSCNRQQSPSTWKPNKPLLRSRPITTRLHSSTNKHLLRIWPITNHLSFSANQRSLHNLQELGHAGRRSSARSRTCRRLTGVYFMPMSYELVSSNVNEIHVRGD